MLQYPNIDPVLLSLGPIQIRWYGVSYLTGVICSYFFLRPILKKRFSLTSDHVTDLLSYCVIGLLCGGRIGYILFYDFAYYIHHPLDMVSIWKGGMSYHGGGIGAVVGMFLYARRMRLPVWGLLDLLGIGSCFGLFFGRIANFINGELFGRVTDVPWAMIFPLGGPFPRHPSQLYEGFFEGIVLFCILYGVMKTKWLKEGQLFGLYLLFYGFFRFCLEFTREPDVQLGFVFDQFTMGQILSTVMMLLGLSVIVFTRKNPGFVEAAAEQVL